MDFMQCAVYLAIEFAQSPNRMNDNREVRYTFPNQTIYVLCKDVSAIHIAQRETFATPPQLKPKEEA
jgi:hypothetical protein